MDCLKKETVLLLLRRSKKMSAEADANESIEATKVTYPSPLQELR